MSSSSGKLTLRCYCLTVRRAAELSLLIALPLLSGCWHDAFRTSVENDTNQTIDVVIDFLDQSIPTAHGEIEAGNGVNLTEHVDAISFIEYRVAERRCRMDAKLIAKVARHSADDVTIIPLSACTHPTT